MLFARSRFTLGPWLAGALCALAGCTPAPPGSVRAANASAPAFSSPRAGALVAGVVPVAVVVPVGASWCNDYVDGDYLRSSPPFDFSWDVSSLAEGGHRLSVTCYDAGGATIGQSAVDVTVGVVALTAPAEGTSVSGAVTLTLARAAASTWANFYVDGSYLASTPPDSAVWDSTGVADGSHVLSARSFDAAGRENGRAAITVVVANGGGGGGGGGGGSCAGARRHYVDAVAGDDRSDGLSPATAWRTLAKVRAVVAALVPGDSVLLARGQTWNEELSLPSGVRGSAACPIYFGAYGTGARPVIDGGGVRAACIAAVYVDVAWLTIDGFECRNTTEYAIDFNAGSALPGIVIENCDIHDTGPHLAGKGCDPGYPSSGCYDPALAYRNQINFEVDNATAPASGVQILDNSVRNCGGHNCIQVHGDGGGAIIRGNRISDGCVHNCIDTKFVVGAVIDGNIVSCVGCAAGTAAIYNENPYLANDSITVTRNLAYDVGIGLQVESGGACSGCGTSVKLYNNTFRAGAYGLIATSCDAFPMTFDVRDNLFDGGSVNLHSGCRVVWDYNDDGGAQGLAGFGVDGQSFGSLSQLQAAGFGAHDLWAVDPRYVDAAAHDFHLAAGSPLSGAGVALVGGLTDIGAY